MSNKPDLENFESIIALIPKLEKFAQTVKEKPDVILNELIELGYRVIDKAKNEAIHEAKEKFKTVITKNNFQFSDSTIKALQSLTDFLKENNQAKK